MNLDVFSSDVERVESFGSCKITAPDREIVVGLILEFREKVVGLNRMDSQVGVKASMWAQTNIHSWFHQPLDKVSVNQQREIRNIGDGAYHVEASVHGASKTKSSQLIEQSGQASASAA